MKKLLSILFLFIFSLFIVNSQPRVISTVYVDSLKNVNINVTSDTKQNMTLEDLQGKLIESQNNQTAINTSMISYIADLKTEDALLNKEIEERNKNDGQLITDVFNYSPIKVKQIMRKERWLNFTLCLLGVFYILFVTNQMAGKYKTSDFFTTKIVFYTLYGVASFYTLHWLFTLLFNGDFYVIKELMKLYT